MQYLSERIRNIEPYVYGEQPQGGTLIKLNTNENPYPVSPRVLYAIQHALLERGIERYPDPVCADLCTAVSEARGVSPAWVFAGNGSDEVLSFAFMAFYEGETLTAPDITYSFYPVYARLFDVDYRTVPLSADFSVDVGSLCQCDGAVILANPNAPTGIALPLSDIEKIISAHPEDVVIVDEAYVDFGGESAVSLVAGYPNLLIVQTLSKFGALAGMRVGYAIGQPHLIEGLNRVKDSFNSYTVNTLSNAAGAAALRDAAYYREQAVRICATRQRVADALIELGFTVLPSSANFLMVRPPRITGEQLYRRLKDRDILIRYFKSPERIAPYVRISIGTDADMDTVCRAVAEIIEE
jgi:histidinol-phosphate aminotransferase